MAALSVQTITVTNAGGSVIIDPINLADAYILEMDGGSVTLASSFEINVSAPTSKGANIIVYVTPNIDLNGNNFSVFGYSLTPNMASGNTTWVYEFLNFSGLFPAYSIRPYDFGSTDFQNAAILQDATVTLSKLENLTSAQIIVGNASNRPTAVTMSGDATISNAGAITIANSAITNAKVSATAAISRSKLASGTASQVVINDGSGVMSSEAQLAPVRGGLGTDASSSTGFVTFSGGTASIGAIYDVITTDVSFESGEQGDFKILLPYACTVTGIYAFAYKAIAGTDNGTIVPKNNAGTTMTDGTITFTASDPRATAYTSTPSANNVFTAGQYLTLTTAKTTAGGKVSLSITVSRNL